MTWVVRTKVPEDPRDRPHYLAAWNDSVPTDDSRRMEWEETQRMAYRFADRNEALKVARSFPISAYDDEVTVVRLVRTPKLPAPLAVLNQQPRLVDPNERWDAPSQQTSETKETGR